MSEKNTLNLKRNLIIGVVAGIIVAAITAFIIQPTRERIKNHMSNQNTKVSFETVNLELNKPIEFDEGKGLITWIEDEYSKKGYVKSRICSRFSTAYEVHKFEIGEVHNFKKYSVSFMDYLKEDDDSKVVLIISYNSK